jgi:hypothetical protein
MHLQVLLVVQKQLVVLIQYIHLQDQEHLRHKIMTSTIKVDNIQDQDGNNIINENANTITIGASGDTIIIPSGATITNNGTQNGFGRTGTVDWDTTVKTSGFTATSGDGFFCNTTSAAFTVTLPASPSAGDIVAVRDYAQTFATNNLTIGRNSEPIDGITTDLILSTNGDGVTLIYVDGTQGWKSVNSNETVNEIKFVAATGGTVTTCGNFKIHKFTGPGTFAVSCAGNAGGSNSVDYMVIAGGGGGGGSRSPGGGAGGGGAGGWRASGGTASGCYSAGPSPLVGCVSALPVSAINYPITVGGAGSGAPGSSPPNATSGSNSVFSTITSAGGGFGGSPNSPQLTAEPGGSGGGTPWQARSAPQRGLGNTPPVSPPQGNNGGLGSGNPHYSGGGGGGAGAVGADAVPNGAAGNGGSSVCSSIDGSPKSYAGGGGGGSSGPPAGGNGGGAGAGKGGGPSSSPGSPDGNGFNASDANRGSGGGAGGQGGLTGGGNGAAGVVVIRYKFQ